MVQQVSLFLSDSLFSDSLLLCLFDSLTRSLSQRRATSSCGITRTLQRQRTRSMSSLEALGVLEHPTGAPYALTSFRVVCHHTSPNALFSLSLSLSISLSLSRARLRLIDGIFLDDPGPGTLLHPMQEYLFHSIPLLSTDQFGIGVSRRLTADQGDVFLGG